MHGSNDSTYFSKFLEMREGSTNTLDKVSIASSRKKNGGFFSFLRRRFSRKRKGSPQYSSAPSVIHYTDNVFMVERHAGDQVRLHARPKNGHKTIESVLLSILKNIVAGEIDERFCQIK